MYLTTGPAYRRKYGGPALRLLTVRDRSLKQWCPWLLSVTQPDLRVESVRIKFLGFYSIRTPTRTAKYPGLHDKRRRSKQDAIGHGQIKVSGTPSRSGKL